MTNLEKRELRQLTKEGLSFEEIRRRVSCSDGTIKQYIKTFAVMNTDSSELDEVLENVWMLGVGHEDWTIPETEKSLAEFKAQILSRYRSVSEIKEACKPQLSKVAPHNGSPEDTKNHAKQEILAALKINSDKKVTRFEVIDHTEDGEGRILTKYDVNIELSCQDDGRTLKVFLTDKLKGE